MKANRAKTLQKSMLARKDTLKWEGGQGKKGNLSYLKMKAVVNMSHPRIAKDDEPCKIPLSMNTGVLDGF